MKTTVILNPASGRGRARKFIPTIERHLRASGSDFDLLQSEQPWHSAILAEAACRRIVNVVIAASGDGTVHETINGRMRAHQAGIAKPALGVLSLGTGNDFASLKGTQATQLEIKMKQATRVNITATKGVMPIQADGEILDAACTEVRIQILQKQLEVIGVL